MLKNYLILFIAGTVLYFASYSYYSQKKLLAPKKLRTTSRQPLQWEIEKRIEPYKATARIIANPSNKQKAKMLDPKRRYEIDQEALADLRLQEYRQKNRDQKAQLNPDLSDPIRYYNSRLTLEEKTAYSGYLNEHFPEKGMLLAQYLLKELPSSPADQSFLYHGNEELSSTALLIRTGIETIGKIGASQPKHFESAKTNLYNISMNHNLDPYARALALKAMEKMLPENPAKKAQIQLWQKNIRDKKVLELYSLL